MNMVGGRHNITIAANYDVGGIVLKIETLHQALMLAERQTVMIAGESLDALIP